MGDPNTMAKLINLKTAAARIRESRAGTRSTSPFFLLCGAGISVPSVPLAWQIEQECRRRAEDLGLASGDAPSDPAGGYSYWLEQAYPDPDQRRAFFRDKIEGQPLTDANLRLAHLLVDGGLTRLLVTPNFDDFCSRALHLFGVPHVVCDHPATTARIDLEGPDVRIVHVHGSYWFYDLINTDDEIEQRAKGYGGSGMSDLLDDVLRARSPLVLGYSGWEGDVIMKALRKRLRKPLKHQLYWFCYRAAGVESLPKWLRKHSNVCFVVPDDDEPLPADRVFDELLRVFKADAPPLTRDPLGFLAERLEASAPARPTGSQPDVYYFEDVIRRIRHAAELAGEDLRGADKTIESVRDAVRRGRYALAARRANAAKLRSWKKPQLKALLDALWPAVSRGGRNATEDLRIHEAFLRVIAERPSAPVRKGRVANVQIARCAAVYRQGHFRKALQAVDDALDALGSQLKSMPRAHQRLLVLKARALVADHRLGAGLEVYDDILERFRKGDARLRAAQIGAARERAALLYDLEQHEDALSALGALVRKLSRSSAHRAELAACLALRADVHRALGDRVRAREDAKQAAALMSPSATR